MLILGIIINLYPEKLHRLKPRWEPELDVASPRHSDTYMVFDNTQFGQLHDLWEPHCWHHSVPLVFSLSATAELLLCVKLLSALLRPDVNGTTACVLLRCFSCLPLEHMSANISK